MKYLYTRGNQGQQGPTGPIRPNWTNQSQPGLGPILSSQVQPDRDNENTSARTNMKLKKRSIVTQLVNCLCLYNPCKSDLEKGSLTKSNAIML